jgi:pimeloyl-ACP methyl ester carboxylesterase
VKPGTLSRIFGRSNASNIWARLVRQLNVDYPQVLTEIIEDTESLSESVVQRVIGTVLESDLRADLARLAVPLLAVFGEKDTIVSAEQARHLREDHSVLQQVIRLPIKTEWRRRVSQLEYI